ncbi:SDR family NAD(P)-dependent oxidoreductase, partial [Vibrio sp. F13]|uniref:SDR family NAD(P)-dependent oxidoreductase n=2 Tax=unclassified Vibrio TaxID=2614977 RepID=UPI0010BD59DB
NHRNTHSADLSTSEGVEKVKQIDKSIGLLVLAAGIEVNGSFAKSSLEQELKMIQLNVSSVLQLTHHFTPTMIERKRGGILMVSSLSGHMVSPYFSNYAGTKAYVLQLGASLHGELKPKGIDVTVLSPGLTTTPMTADNGVDWSKLPMVAKDPAEVAEIAINGLGRKAVVVPGKRNRMTAILSGIIPHQKQAIMGESMIGKAMPNNKM